MKKIAFLVPDFGSGKAARSIRSQGNARALTRRGYEVSVLAARDDGHSTIPGVSTMRTWSPHPSNEASFVWRVLGEVVFGIEAGVRLALGRYDHVIITTPPFLSMLCAVFLLRLRGRKYSLDVRDLFPDVYAVAGLMDKSNPAYRIVDRMTSRAYAGAAALVGATESLSRKVAVRSGRSEVPVVMNGYLDELFFPRKSEAASPGAACTVVCHGNFGALFDDETFVAIARGLAAYDLNYRILLVGFGAKLQRLKDAALPNVDIRGAMPHAEVAELVRQSDIGLSVHYAYEEAFPVKVLEYIGAGLPALVIPRNEGGRVIESNGLGYAFGQQDLDGAIEALRKMISSRQHRDDIAQRIRGVRGRFSRAAQSEKFADAIQNVIQGAPTVDHSLL